MSRWGPLSRWAAGALLVLAIPLVPLPYVAAAVIALILGLAPARPSSPLPAIAAAVHQLVLPFVWGAVVPGRPEVAVLAAVGSPWLLHRLQTLPSSGAADLIPLSVGGRRPTRRLAAVCAGFGFAAASALVAGQRGLALASAVALGMVLAMVAVSLARFRPHRLRVETQPTRALAGATVLAGAKVRADGGVGGDVRLEPAVPWAAVTPETGAVGTEALSLRVRAVPPLAGSGAVSARVVWTDPWGLVGVVFHRSIAELRVIPRARYAAWLARRYLASSRRAGASAVAIPEALSARRRRGIEYFGARFYQAGDRLRDILWKQTAKLGELVVADRRDDLAQTAIVAVRLAGRDADEADRLAAHLLMTTLTLAQDGIPVALAAYTSEGIRSVTPALAPRQAVQQALSLSEMVTVAPAPKRLLAPAYSPRLRRLLTRLERSSASAADGERQAAAPAADGQRQAAARPVDDRAQSAPPALNGQVRSGVSPAAGRPRSVASPAISLARLLVVELDTLRHAARHHPASRALTAAVTRGSAPAIVVVISAAADDHEVLTVTLEALRARGFQRLDLLPVTL